jgi:hypothetical protein
MLLPHGSEGRAISRLTVGAGMFIIVVLVGSSWSGRPAVAAAGGRWLSAVSVASCPVALPNGGHPSGQPPEHGWYHGTNGLWAFLWWKNGTAVIPHENVQRNGWLYLKVAWWRDRGSYGTLRIVGKRLDEPAPALHADVPVGYGPRGLQATALLFPTVGCWRVTGRSGRGRLTMVIRVVKARR